MRGISPTLTRLLLYVFLIVATIGMAFPLFWMVSSSLKSLGEANSPGIVWVPREPTTAAYTELLHNANFLRTYFNTAFYTGLALVGTLASVAAVAYAFSRIEWPGRNVVFFLMLSTLLIPA